MIQKARSTVTSIHIPLLPAEEHKCLDWSWHGKRAGITIIGAIRYLQGRLTLSIRKSTTGFYTLALVHRLVLMQHGCAVGPPFLSSPGVNV